MIRLRSGDRAAIYVGEPLRSDVCSRIGSSRTVLFDTVRVVQELKKLESVFGAQWLMY